MSRLVPPDNSGFLSKIEIISDKIRLQWSCIELPSYKAFLYIMHVSLNGTTKHYGGFHTRKDPTMPLRLEFLVNYMHSSKDPGLASDLAHPDSAINYEIVAVGTTNEMRQAEHELLAREGAASNPSWYNKSNGGGKNVKKVQIDIYKEHIDKILSNVESGRYETRVFPKDELKLMPKIQARMEQLDYAHKKELQQIMEEKGTDGFIVHLLEDENKIDHNNTVANGNHTVDGSCDAKTIKELNCMMIPYDDWKILKGSHEDYALNVLSLRLNKNPKIRTKENSDDDIANSIMQAIYHYNLFLPDGTVSLKDNIIQTMLNDYSISKHKCQNILKIVRENITRKRALARGVNIIDWDYDINNTEKFLGKKFDRGSPKEYLQGIIGSCIQDFGKSVIVVKVSRGSYFPRTIEKAYLTDDGNGNPFINKGTEVVILYHDPIAFYFDKPGRDTADKVVRRFNLMYEDVYKPTNTFIIKKIVHLPVTTSDLAKRIAQESDGKK